MSVFTLMHKDIPVLDCKFNGPYLVDVQRVHELEHVPVGCTGLGGRFSCSYFIDWWTRRSVPRTRVNLKDIESVLVGKSTNSLAINAYACNLSDQYWIRPAGSSVQYKDVNFFTNDFGRDLGDVFLGRNDYVKPRDIILVSPDSASCGNLPKAWKIINGTRVLLKSTAGGARQEPWNEVVGSRLCDVMRVPHVKYSIMKDKNDVYSACACCVTCDEEIVTAFDITRHDGHIPGDILHEIGYYRSFAKDHGVSNIDDSISQMAAVDFLLRNEDRHWTNFGLVRDANTLEYLRPVPLLDFGNSLFYSCSDRDIGLRQDVRSKFSGMLLQSDLGFVFNKSCMNMERAGSLPFIVNSVLSGNESMTRARKSLLHDACSYRVGEFMRRFGLESVTERGFECEY